MASLAQIRVDLLLNAAPFLAGLKAAKTAAMTTGTALNTAIGVGGVIVAAGMVKATQAAMEWENAMDGVRRTVTLTDEQNLHAEETYQGIDDDLRHLARTIPITHAELASMAETAGALGVGAEDITEFSRVAATLAELSDDLTPDSTARAMGKIRQVMGMANDEFDKFGSAVVTLGVSGASTEAEILSMAQRASGAFSALNISTQDLLAWSAAMANTGEPAEAGGTSLQRLGLILQKNILDNGPKLESIAKTAGMTGEAFADMFNSDASAGMFAYIKGLSELDSAQRGLALRAAGFTDIRITRGLNKIVSAFDEGLTGSLPDALEQVDEGWNGTSELARQAAVRWDNVATKTEQLGIKLYDLGITIGNHLLPYVGMFVDFASMLVDGINDLLQAFPALTAVITPLIAALSGFIALKFGARLVGSLLPGATSSFIGAKWAAVATAIQGALRGALSLAWAGAGAAARLAISAAGAAAGAVYAGAAFIGTKLLDAAFGLWAAIGRPGSRVMMAATLAGSATAGSFLMGIAKGLTVVGIAVVVGEAINEGLRRAGIEPTPWDEIIPIGPASTKDWLRSKGIQVERDTFDPLKESMTDQLAAIHPSLFAAGKELSASTTTGIAAGFQQAIAGLASKIKGSISTPIKMEFAAARKAMAEGFGNIKQALASPPQLISRQDRMENMEGKMRKIVANVRKAIKADDPVNIAYWTKAGAAAAQRMGRMGTKGKVVAGDVKNQFRAMGINIKTTFGGVETKAKATANSVRTGMLVSATQTAAGIQARFNGMDLAAAGINLVSTLASGMRAAIPQVFSVAAEISGLVSKFFAGNSPPPMGPLRTIDTDGANLVRTLSGGMLSQRGLATSTGHAIAGAFRPSWGAGAVAAAGMGARGGHGGDTYQIGTLIADDRGIDELDRRINRRKKMKGRGNMRFRDRD